MGKPAATDRPCLRSLSHSFTLDFLIFVRSQRAAQRVLRSISRFIERRLRLRINPIKTRVARLSACTFLGFELRRGKFIGPMLRSNGSRSGSARGPNGATGAT